MNRSRDKRGHSMIELLFVSAIAGLILGAVVPVGSALRRRAAVRLSAGSIRAVFQQARFQAIARGRHVGVKFWLRDGHWSFARYEDGDFDGIRNDDIRSGVDRQISIESDVLPVSNLAQIALPPFPIREPDGSRSIRPSDSAVRFNRSTLCSFAPNGSSTPGSIYLSDRAELVAVVRVYGPTARIRTLVYDRSSARWK